MVVWWSDGSGGTDTDGSSIQGQRYNAAGSPQDSEFQVNTYTTNFQVAPAVARDADGDFVVVWESRGSGGTDTSLESIQGQRYLSDNPPTPTDTPTPTRTATPTDTPTPTRTATPQAPTAADLRYFRAIGLADRAILVWETATEADTLGFNVLRAATLEGPWAPVNRALIPAEGGVASGQTYVLRDAPGPGAWHYLLEDVGAAGKRTPHPAAAVRVGPGATGGEVFVPIAAAGRR